MINDKISILLLSIDLDLCNDLEKKLSKKSAHVCVKLGFEDALDFLLENQVTHIMIDLCFTAFEKAKFLKNLKKISVILPKIKTISFKEVLNKFDPNNDKVVISSRKSSENNFVHEVNSFIMGDKLDISHDFTQLYKNELKTFVQFGQVSCVVEFLEMTKTGMVVYSDEMAIIGDYAQIKIENFINKTNTSIEIKAIISKCEREGKKYFIELELDQLFIDKWNELYEEYVERQLAIDEFMFSQKY